MLRLNDSGELLWENTFGGTGDEFYAQVIDAVGDGFIVSGNANSPDGDINGNNGDRDAWLVCVDDSGNLLWESSFGGSGIERAIATFQKADGSFYVLAHFNSSDGDLSSNYGGYDFWLIELNPDPLSVEESFDQPFSVFPNPAVSELTIQLDRANERGLVRITDVSGKILEELVVNSGLSMPDIRDYASGI